MLAILLLPGSVRSALELMLPPLLPVLLLPQISAVLYIPLLKGRIFSAEEPDWNKRSLDVGVAEVRGILLLWARPAFVLLPAATVGAAGGL